MHEIIGDLLARNKPAKPLLRFAHYLDTTSFFFPIVELMTIETRRLRELYDGHKPHRHVNFRKGYHILTFQCPQPELIWECEALADKYGGNHSRVDIASDDRSGSNDFIEQTNRLLNMMLLRGRKAKPVGIHENQDGTIGVILNPYSRSLGHKPPPRDLVIYPDPCSKLFNRPAAHFDYRLRSHARLRALRDQGIGIGMKSLTEFDPAQELRNNLKFVKWERDKFLQRLERQLHKKNDGSEPHARRAFALAKRYGQLECAQRVQDQYRTTLVEDPKLVMFSHSLTWGARRRALGHMVKVYDDDHVNLYSMSS
jgi:hypothetical protein